MESFTSFLALTFNAMPMYGFEEMILRALMSAMAALLYFGVVIAFEARKQPPRSLKAVFMPWLTHGLIPASIIFVFIFTIMWLQTALIVTLGVAALYTTGIMLVIGLAVGAAVLLMKAEGPDSAIEHQP